MRVLVVFLSIIAIQNILSAQNIGINTSNPKEIIHMQRDTQNVVLRFDNRKSAINGTVDTIIRCSAGSVVVSSFLTGVPWQTIDIQDLQNSDDVYAISGELDFSDITENLQIYFDCDHVVPSDATINSAVIDYEIVARSNGPNPPGRIIVSGSLSNDLTSGEYFAAFADSLVVERVYTGLASDLFLFTGEDINDGLLNAHFRFLASSEDVFIFIDKVEIAINYTYPATGLEEVRWTAGTQNGKFNISKSPSITNNQYLSISEVGQTRLKSLQITDNAADGKILTSAADGSALWSYPSELGLGSNLIWSQLNDTAYYDQGPVHINSNDELQLMFNNGRTRLQNSENFIVTQNAKVNLLLDTDNASNDDVFAIYHNKNDASNAPIVKFHLEGENGWINSGDLGLRTNNPNTDLHLVHGPASESDGFKLQQQGSNQFWRMFTNGGGQLLLFNTNSPIAPIGSFSPVNGAYTALSDERAKKNVHSLGPVIPTIRLLHPKKYSFAHDESSKEFIGFIAQDVMNYFPEVVNYHEEMDRYTMDYSAFSVLAIQAIKELDERVTRLEKMVIELSGK